MTDGSAPGRGAPLAAPSASRARRLWLTLCFGIFFAGFVALGTWQIYRLQWKLALIQRVNSRVHAAPVAAPGPAQWPAITDAADSYRHVRVTGLFLNRQSTLVKAVTELGGGYWLLTPLQAADGSIYLINRGFVSQAPPASADATQPVTVTGLLRMTEPGGAFLHHNDPRHNLWYSRDVAAIAQAQHLSHVAPYFIDADAAANPVPPAPDRPVGGLTVIHFYNHHLIYVITWYALALMVAAYYVRLLREERRRAGGGGADDGDEADDGQD